MISSKSGLDESIYTAEIGKRCKSRSPPPPRAGLPAAHHCQKYYKRSAAFTMFTETLLCFSGSNKSGFVFSFHYPLTHTPPTAINTFTWLILNIGLPRFL